MKKVKTIDIIGGGVSGMATAYYLSKTKNIKIRVWESSDCVGGLASNFAASTFEVERFYHHIFKKDKDLLNLIKDVGLEEQMIWNPAAVSSLYGKKIYALSSPIDLLKFKPLSFINRIRLGVLALWARTTKDWKRLDNKTVKDYVISISGNKVWDVVWKPLFNSKFGKHADNISAAWLWSKLVDRGGSRNSKGHEILGYLDGGLGRMFEAIKIKLESEGHQVNIQKPINSIIVEDNRVKAIMQEKTRYETDMVIATSQIPEIVKLLPNTLSNLKEELNKIKFLANTTLVLIMNKPLTESYWINITNKDTEFVGVIEQTNWIPKTHYDNKHVIYFSTYLSEDDRRYQMNIEELYTLFKKDIVELFPNFKESSVLEKYKWNARNAQAVVHKGYRHIIPNKQTSVDNLLIASMAQIYPNDRQVANGVRQAKEVVGLINSKIES